MDTSQTDDVADRHSLTVRVLVVIGALFGFTLLALAVAGVADASEGSPPPARPGLLARAGNAVHDGLKPVDAVLKPVTGTVHAVSSQVAPVVKPVTSGLSPVLAPLTRPVLQAAEPVLQSLRPVTEPVVHALSPVTSPVLRATAPVTEPVVRAIGAGQTVPVVVPPPGTGSPVNPAPRGDVSAPSVVAVQVAPAGQVAPVVGKQGAAQRRHDAPVGFRHVAGNKNSDGAGVAGPLSGSGGGGLPVDISGTSSGMSAGSGGGHGGEYAVTASRSAVPVAVRNWRAPPAGEWSLHWLEYYGNDHPS